MSPRRSLLVVEDDADLREFFRLSLTTAGYDVRTAVDGLQALERLEAIVPDVVVLDLILPGINGYDVLNELACHAYTRNIPVVIVSGLPTPPVGANIACFLRKPVTADQLVSAIQRCVTQGGEPQGT
jgi:CheY-like chemotaxis protein